MRIRLLGPVEIEVEGARVGVGGPRAQAVLAVLKSVPPGLLDDFTVARYLCASGRTGAAQTHLAGIEIDGSRLRLRRDLLERPALDNLAFLAARLHQPELAAAVPDRLEPLADTFGHVVVAHPIGHHWLGVLALTLQRPATRVPQRRPPRRDREAVEGGG